jgi:hypothetical protein
VPFDQIRVSTAMFANFAATAGHIGGSGGNTVVFTADYSAYIILLNTNSTSLTAANFNFVA